MAATSTDAYERDAAFAEFAWQAARDAGAAILPHFRAPIEVEDKGGARGYDPVTEADRAAEAAIRGADLLDDVDVDPHRYTGTTRMCPRRVNRFAATSSTTHTMETMVTSVPACASSPALTAS